MAQTFISDALGDDAVQSAHVDEFASRPVSVLLLTPNTAAGLTEAAKRALAKKIPVITLDRSVDVEVTQHIGADNKLIGKTAAEYVSQDDPRRQRRQGDRDPGHGRGLGDD